MRQQIALSIGLLMGLGLLMGAMMPSVGEAQTTTRVSVDSQGGEANGDSAIPALSADGRVVAFHSTASDLVVGDGNDITDIFVHDRQTGATSRVSVNSQGGEANGGGGPAILSADGRVVAFNSFATNLVPGDNNGEVDIFVHDRQTGATSRVSVNSQGGEANGTHFTPALSADGRFVVFESSATNLIPGDTNGVTDMFVHDRQTGATTRVSVNNQGGEANGASYIATLSADGRVVAFASEASDLVAGDNNGALDVFVRDMGLGGAPPASLVSAVLPSSRSVQVGTTATAFGLLINGGTTTATSCSLAPGTTIPATFSYQTTDPTTNALTGSPNTPVDLAAGQSQTFIVSLTPTAEIPPTDVPLSFDCTNTDPAPSTVGLNTLLLSASTTPIPDIVALVATPTNDGITHLPGATGGIGSTGVFVVASLNVGATGTMTVGADTGTGSLPLAITLCQTNTGTGACLAPPGSNVTTDILANTTPSFGVFVEGLGPIPFDPATNRIFIRFKDQGGITRGSTSVAVQTDGPAPLTITSTATLPPGTVNQPYNATLTASGGTAPFSWSVIAGALPGGLTLDPSTGQISGTPTTSGTFTGTFQLQDSSIIQQSAQQIFSVTITSLQSGGSVGNWLLVNFLSTDETEFDDDDLDGIGFSAIITETTWTESDEGGCTVTYALFVDGNNHHTKTATAVSGCPFGNEALPLLNETGRLEFEGNFMNEFFDLQPGDEISAFRWLRQ